MRLRDLRVLAKLYIRRWLGTNDGRRVLDVGAGHLPHEDATHLVDLLPKDTAIHGKPVKRVGRPLVIATVEALPFKDKVFDYIYACHVIEHVNNQTQACHELSRIGRAGYIETPSPFFEQGYNYPLPDRGWTPHLWFVYVREDQTLVFEPKTKETIDHFCDCKYANFIKRVFTKVGDLNRVRKVLPYDCNNTVLNWVGEVKVEVRAFPHDSARPR